ncbi:hypothetical protein BTVI_82323 [Pitangus sulphuratus]|nr:hypothetical protein BTVI_82323 [Pitangus sulphuratus]
MGNQRDSQVENEEQKAKKMDGEEEPEEEGHVTERLEKFHGTNDYVQKSLPMHPHMRPNTPSVLTLSQVLGQLPGSTSDRTSDDE